MENKNQIETNKKKRERSSPYPQFNLRECEDFAQKIFDMGAKNILLDGAAQAQGYKNKDVGAFLALKAAARYFGLVEYDKDYISVAEPVIKIFLEKSPTQRLTHIRSSILLPVLYKKIFDNFEGKQLPDDDDLARRLAIAEDYGISKEASKTAANIFRESAAFAELLDNNNYLRLPKPKEQEGEQSLESLEKENRVIQAKGEAQHKTNLLDRYEITLQGGSKITLLLPPVLTLGDKKRLIAMIELIPDETENKGGKNGGE